MNLFFHKGALVCPSQKEKKKQLVIILILIGPMLVVSLKIISSYVWESDWLKCDGKNPDLSLRGGKSFLTAVESCICCLLYTLFQNGGQ